MYLKQLEIQGFKSFADKTRLELKPGITVIVGPNGSGKSNISDAVRWVLGEQSIKSLRGGKMEDVIFAGSEQRRSLGMAEVSLTIDNSSGRFPLDFNEVTVTRRLYRSGESDYLINRVPCRLKDVHELFMDTGIGREGFSIIGQGRIDEILTVKPEERRGLIEEAAGIVKYRYRKRDAERKLEDTQNNLLRVSDIITELESQEEPLAEQARVAKIYRGLKGELDGLEIGIIIEEAETAVRRLENIKNNRQKEERELEETRTRYLQAQAGEEEYKLVLRQKEDQVAACQEKVYSENLRLEKNESEKKLLFERQSDLKKQGETLNNDLENLRREREELQKEQAEHGKQGEELRVQLSNVQQALTTYEEEVANENRIDGQQTEKLDQLRGEHFAALSEESRIHNDKNAQQQKLQLLSNQEEQLESKQKLAAAELEKVKETLTVLDLDAAKLLDDLKTSEESIRKKEQTLKAEERKHQEIQADIRSLLDEKNSAAARLKLLAEMEREGQGYGQGVREILHQKEKKTIQGIIGTVAQIFNVPGKYETAVEVVLGGSLQHIITENEAVAQKSIEWLKKNDKGRVTFLPLTTVRGGRIKDNIPSGEGVIGRLCDLVTFEKTFAGIAEYLLGRIWLIEDLDTAIRKARETGFNFRLVTLDGQLVNVGGSLTGGSIKVTQGSILSRKRNIQELEEEISRLEHSIRLGEEKQKKIARLLLEIDESVVQQRKQVQELQIKKAENEKSRERWLADHQRHRSELQNMAWQKEEMTAERDLLTKCLQETEEGRIALALRVEELTRQLSELQETVRAKQIERVRKNEKLTQLRIEVATVQEKMSSFQKEEQNFQNRLRQINQLQHDKIKELSQLKERKKSLEESHHLIEDENQRQLQIITELEQQLALLKLDKHNAQELINQTAEIIKKTSDELHNREEKLHQFELQQSKHEMTLEAAERRLSEQYELDLSQARTKAVPVGDRKTTLLHITELKTNIAELGDVNHAAIEEYARLRERLDFLSGQMADMSQAKEKLEQVIREMDQIMTRKFKETFKLVDQAFQEMFNRLFGGGRAQLVLTSEEKPLEAGMDIIAQPPGKKTQYLSLLSGGEKALTAIALLMAMLKIKPSPFCVLDEIESNLDEANVQRFANILQDFSHGTQFIVISHHKGTMEVGHVLYGVTIEESGVSRLISVRLEDVKKERTA